MSLPEWSTACPDWQDRIRDGRSLIPFAPLFPGEAELAREAFGALAIVDVAGSPLMKDVCRPWILDFVGAIFGALDPTSGRRLIREFLLLISKKNGKSTTAAGIMITALMRNWRLSNEFLILAPTLEIAKNSFYPARDMINANDYLRSQLHVQEHYRTITHKITKATLTVVAADSDTVGGKKAAGVLIDELWLFGKRAGAENMLREATGGMASRPEGFTIYLSTQSDDRPAGVFKSKVDYFRKVRDGEIVDKRSLPVLYEFPPDMVQSKAYMQTENFFMTNPNLGSSVDEEWLREKLTEAQAGAESSLHGFVAKHLNVEIGIALGSDAWPGARHWEKNGDPELTLPAILERCDVVTIGVDGGGLDDLLGLAVLGRIRGTRKWLHWGHAWVHRDVLTLRKSEAPRLLDLEAVGDLEIVDTMGAAFAALVDLVDLVNAAGVLLKVGLDPVGVKIIVDEMARRGITQDGGQVEGVSQGFKLQGTIKSVEDHLSDGNLTHCAQALMAWAVGNAKVKVLGNSIMVTKQASGTGKIDPVMALYDAAALMLAAGDDVSVYSANRGLTVFG